MRRSRAVLHPRAYFLEKFVRFSLEWQPYLLLFACRSGCLGFLTHPAAMFFLLFYPTRKVEILLQVNLFRFEFNVGLDSSCMHGSSS